MPDRFIDEFLFRLVDGYTDADTGEFRPIYVYRPSVIPRPHPYERDRLDAPLTTHRIEDLFHAMSMRYAFLRTAMCATEDVPAEFPMASLPTGEAMEPRGHLVAIKIYLNQAHKESEHLFNLLSDDDAADVVYKHSLRDALARADALVETLESQL